MSRHSSIDPKIREVLPKGAQVTKRQGKESWYAYFQDVRYDKVSGKGKPFKKYIGTVFPSDSGYIFNPNSNYLAILKEQETLKETLEQKRKAAEIVDSIEAEIKVNSLEPRREDLVVYPLKYILFVVFLAGLNGIRDCQGVAIYWSENRPWFEKTFEDFPQKDISHDTVRRVLCLMEESKTETFFEALVTPILDKYKEKDDRRVVALDGQAVNASRVEDRMPYLLNIYDATNGVAILTERIEKKKNEISAAPDLIRKLNLSGCTLTCDALNTQRRTVNAVIGSGGNYCCAVKDNQKGLAREIEDAFLRAQIQERGKRGSHGPSQKDRLPLRKIFSSDVELDHGRIEKRIFEVLPGSVLSTKETTGWDGLAEGCIVKTTTESIDKKTGKDRGLVRYYISSHIWREEGVERILGQCIRSHWGIENGLHHVLDVNLGQDWIQAKNPTYVTNRIRLNHMIFNYIKAYQKKLREDPKGGKDLPFSQIQKKCSTPEKALKIL